MNSLPDSAAHHVEEIQQQLAAIIDLAYDAIIAIDNSMRVITFNQGAEAIFGYSAAEIMGRPIDRLLPEHTRTAHRRYVRRFGLDRSAPRRMGERQATHGRRKDGSLFAAEVSIAQTTINGRQIYTAILRDISERRQAEQQLREREQLLRSIYDGVDLSIFIVDVQPDGEFTYVGLNPAHERLTGITNADLQGKTPDQVLPPQFAMAVRRRYQECVAAGGVISYEERLPFQGQLMDWLTTLTPLHDSQGRIHRLIGTSHNISTLKESQRQLRHNALHDSLTGLPNRTLLSAKLAGVGAQTAQEPSRRIALLFIDIDRFKVVNDTMGHLAGDQLLLAFTQRVRQVLRQHDMLARLGGDEFVIVIDPVASDADALAVAQAIHQILEQPFIIDAREAYITTSIGVAISGDTFHRPEYLLRNADIAMRRAKADGPRRHAIFDAAMHQQTIRRVQLEQDLRQAIDRRRIKLHYQPVVAMDGLRLVGFEALARWENPHLGMIAPSEFIALAEEIGLMVPLTYQFIDQICAQLTAWRQVGPGADDLYISLNLMSRPLIGHQLVAYCNRAMRQHGLPPSKLAIEITENILIENAEVVRTLNELEQAGHPLLLDDFGTGYSSLQWLRRLNLHAIKIDRSFIGGATADLANRAIVRTIISLAQSLGLSVIAEGVETEQQRSQLHTLGAHAFQGFLVSPAMSSSDATAFLSQWAPQTPP